MRATRDIQHAWQAAPDANEQLLTRPMMLTVWRISFPEGGTTHIVPPGTVVPLSALKSMLLTLATSFTGWLAG